MNEEEMREIAGVSISRKLAKGELLFQSEELSEHLFIVHKGRVKIYRLTENGKEQIIRFIESGDFVGELALFSNTVTSNFAEAMEDTEICSINQRDFQQLLLQYPTISLKVLEEVSSRLTRTETLVEKLNSQDVEKRIASYLVELMAESRGELNDSIQLQLPISKGDLASILGTSQETLSRRLSSFQNKGLIELKGQRTIIIKQPEQLEDKALN
ncbi:Crp/Fnr family transcriptional regulator [Fredinandcohnia sp. 179-A 10B2 NHS]|uniref:Crp/Fnr family transcriptional regulator n=1 Tax=Fredinandcohnia sp. 179-A 10B2 NHS TaxID=3235176 RepID=UPI0039A3EDB5